MRLFFSSKCTIDYMTAGLRLGQLWSLQGTAPRTPPPYLDLMGAGRGSEGEGRDGKEEEMEEEGREGWMERKKKVGREAFLYCNCKFSAAFHSWIIKAHCTHKQTVIYWPRELDIWPFKAVSSQYVVYRWGDIISKFEENVSTRSWIMEHTLAKLCEAWWPGDLVNLTLDLLAWNGKNGYSSREN